MFIRVALLLSKGGAVTHLKVFYLQEKTLEELLHVAVWLQQKQTSKHKHKLKHMD